MVFLLLVAIVFNYWLLAGLFFLITLFGLWEFYSIFTTEAVHPQRLFGTIGGILLYMTSIVVFRVDIPDLPVNPSFIPILLAIPLFFLPFVFEIYRRKPQPLVNVAITITGILYIALPLALLNMMNGEEVVRFWKLPVVLTGFFILTWIYDTGAYLFGKRFGKHELFKRISPKKTWEGTIAGAVLTLLASVGLYFLAPDISLPDWIIFSILIILFGSFGDLAESLFKRSFNIKDSGSILPGHGGILDRFDSIFISVPFVFLYLVLRNLI